MNKKKKKVHWSDSRLISCGISYVLCASEEMFAAGLESIDVPNNVPFVSDGHDATTHFIGTDRGEFAFICISPHSNVSGPLEYALIAHEAVHIWQKEMENIGEKNPSSEFEAFGIQQICVNLFLQYEEQTK